MPTLVGDQGERRCKAQDAFVEIFARGFLVVFPTQKAPRSFLAYVYCAICSKILTYIITTSSMR